MLRDIVIPVFLLATGYLGSSFSDAIGLDFSVVFSNMQREHWIVGGYILVVGGVIVWGIMDYRHKKLKKQLKKSRDDIERLNGLVKSYKDELKKRDIEDEDIQEWRAILRHEEDDSSIKA